MNFDWKKAEKNFVNSRICTTFALAFEKTWRSLSPGGGMVDALVSGASGESRAGSSRVLGTDVGEVAEW